MFKTTEVIHALLFQPLALVLYWIDMAITKQQNLKFCLEK